MYSHVSTERLLLRKPTHDDLNALHDIHSDPETNAFNPSGPHTSLTQSREMLAVWLERWTIHGYGYWTVLERETSTILGFGGLSPKEINGRAASNLYFRFRPTAWGRGYATELGRVALKAGCSSRLPEVTAQVRPDNVPSIRVLERLGLERRGELRDQYGLNYLYVWKCSSE